MYGKVGLRSSLGGCMVENVDEYLQKSVAEGKATLLPSGAVLFKAFTAEEMDELRRARAALWQKYEPAFGTEKQT